MRRSDIQWSAEMLGPLLGAVGVWFIATWAWVSTNEANTAADVAPPDRIETEHAGALYRCQRIEEAP